MPAVARPRRSRRRRSRARRRACASNDRAGTLVDRWRAAARGGGGRVVRRVLGLLPAATRCGRCPTCKAWHERYARRGLTVVSVHSPGFRVSADEDARARRGRAAAGSSTRCCSTRTSRSGASTRTPAGRVATCGARTACSSTTTTARAPTRSASSRSASCSAIAARADGAAAPRGRAGRGARRPLPGPPRASRSTGPTRRARSGRCSTAAARVRVNGREIEVEHPGRVPAGRARRATAPASWRSSRARACAARRSASRRGWRPRARARPAVAQRRHLIEQPTGFVSARATGCWASTSSSASRSHPAASDSSR